MTDKPTIGVFICHCGKNIAGSVKIEDVRTCAKRFPNVVVAKDYMFMCSETGQNLIKDCIKEYGLNRVVVASCTPKLHEPTFRRCVEEAGLNKFHLEIANIREQCSLPHLYEPERATEKAKRIVKAAVARAAQLEEVGFIEEGMTKAALVIGGGIAGIQAALALAEKSKGINNSVLVVGGGIAGIQAALDLADRGCIVYLVEELPVVGGNMAKVYKTFPTDDCAMCILSPKLNEVRSHPNIKLLAYSEVMRVEGNSGDFTVKTLRKPRYVDESKCTGCGTCAEKCPAKVPDVWGKIGFRKAIYIPFPQGVPLKYTIDKEHCLYFTKGICKVCEKLCLAEAIKFNDEPEEIEIKVGAIIVATGFEELDPTILERYGYGRYANVVTQLQLARMFDPVGLNKGKALRPSDGKPPNKIIMVQCVGSRDIHYCQYCSTVCCMAALKHAQLIKIEQNQNAEITICYIDLRAAGKGYEEYYERAQSFGIRFVRGAVAEVYEKSETKNPVLRVEDTLLGEVIEHEAELVVLSAAILPSKGTGKISEILGLPLNKYGFIERKHSKLFPVDTEREGVFVCGCAAGPFDIPDSVAQGSAAAARVVEFLKAKSFKTHLVEKSPFLGGNTLKIHHTLLTDEETTGMLNSLNSKVYENSQIEVLTNSEVKEVEGHLGNFTVKIARKPRHINIEKCDACGECTKVCPYETVDEWNCALGKRKAIYLPHPGVYPKAFAIDPNICKFEQCGKCVEACPQKAINLKEKAEQYTLNVGVIIVATGLSEYNPTNLAEYGYGRYPNVITQLQLARILDPSGPTKGELSGPSDKPKSVLIIQCVGSRDKHSNIYCSRICCGIALKSARWIKQKDPEIEVCICYIDARAFGYLEDYYKETQMLGVRFIRGKVAEVIGKPGSNRLTVKVEDTLLGKVLELTSDLVVLSTAMVASEDTAELAKTLGIDVGSDGFLKEVHPKLRPVDTKVEGIYICGGAQCPKDVADSVVQALAASAKASVPLYQERIKIELTKAVVDEKICVGCGNCKNLCAYDAIEIVQVAPHKKVARVIEAECRGCGTCAGICRTGAIQLRHYKDHQLLSQIESLLTPIPAE